MLGFYDLHVAYAEQYGLENYLYQLEHPDTDKLQSDSKFLNFVGEKMKREFEAQGREFLKNERRLPAGNEGCSQGRQSMEQAV